MKKLIVEMKNIIILCAVLLFSGCTFERSDIEKKIPYIEDRIDDIEKEIVELEDEIENLESELENIESEIE